MTDRRPAPIDEAIARLAGGGARVMATIWATVDLDRALTDLVPSGRSPATWTVSADSLLGARVAVIALDPGDRGDPPIAVAEPTTEGRLAAGLARHGEGPAGHYVAVGDDLGAARARAAAAGIAVSRAGDGPFGPAILVLLGPLTGPHLILCDPLAVPSRA